MSLFIFRACRVISSVSFVEMEFLGISALLLLCKDFFAKKPVSR